MNPALNQVLVYLYNYLSPHCNCCQVPYFLTISLGLDIPINYYYLEWAMYNIVWKNNENFCRFYPL